MVRSRDRMQSNDESTFLRKIRKPLVEKKRRERMNDSSSKLKSRIADTIKQHTVPMTRLDKADILELTVTHITQLQHQQRAETIAPRAASGYNTGFKECARDIITVLTTANIVDVNTLRHLNGHLHQNFLKRSSSSKQSIYMQNDNRTSTPINTRAQYLPQTTLRNRLPRCSPIVNINQRTVEDSSFVYDKMASSFRNSTRSLDTSSGFISGLDSCCSSQNDYSSVELNDKSNSNGAECCGIVTIGTGSENDVGHVIKDSVWRPW